MLDARQLGLKLIANVTYGYTGASFSGRMPCVEVGAPCMNYIKKSETCHLENTTNQFPYLTTWHQHIACDKNFRENLDEK